MYQYKGVLKGSKEVIAEGHTVADIEHATLHYRREQKKGQHTNANVPVEIIHVKHNIESHHVNKEELVKII